MTIRAAGLYFPQIIKRATAALPRRRKTRALSAPPRAPRACKIFVLHEKHPYWENCRIDTAVRCFHAARNAQTERIVKDLKAIIMAGGEGSRLRPLTCDCPKPMLRLMGKPLMEHAVRLLQRYGVQDVGVTLGYLPDAVMDHFGDGASLGVRLRYFVEESPLGTAGGVLRAREFLDETFIVLSGDGVTDVDLGAALRFHRARGAAATLVLVKSERPQEYGMVVTSEDGRVRAFHEKPGRSDVYSEWINTGIYILEPEILERIPEGAPCDFGHDLFPALLREGAPLYGWAAEGYWCDVGDVGAYLRAHADAMDGKIALPDLSPRTEGAIIEEGAIVEMPALIAPGAHICAGARVGAYSAIGAGCFVAPGADVKRSLLFDGARIEPRAQLRGCVVAANAVVGEGAQLFEESAVGSGSRVGARATLPPGVKLWPQKQLPEGERPEANIVWGARREQRFIGGALMLESPAQAARAAQSCAAERKPRELLVGRGASAVAQALWHAVTAGLIAQGVQAVDAGACTLPQLRHALSAHRADGAMLVEDDRLIPLDAAGAILAERAQRSILRLLERQDFAGPFSGVTRPLRAAGPTDAPYVADCAAEFGADPLYAPPVALCARDALALDRAERAFVRAGLRIRSGWNADELRPVADEIGVEIERGGERARISCADGQLSEVERQLACAWTALERGETRLILPLHATRAIEALAARYGAHALYLPGERAVWMAALAEKAQKQLALWLDGARMALAFLSELCDRGLSLAQWRASMPAAFRSAREVPAPASQQGRLLHALAARAPGAELGGGVRLTGDSGWAWLSPDEAGTGLSVVAESPDMESARELCDFYGGELERLLSAARD